MSEKYIACNLTYSEINSLADKVESGRLSKVKIKNGDCEIVIEKENKVPPMPVMPPVGMSPMPVMNEVSTLPQAEEKEETISGKVVKAPIVGTFYSAPSPDKAPFVEIGSQVKKGDVLMIIESMKLMNEVQSEYDGKVKEILVENGSAVEYDQPIMIIE